MERFSSLEYLIVIIAIIGTLNWGLVGLFHFDLVAAIFGNMTLMSRTVYTLVGISGIGLIYVLFREQKH